MKLFLSIQLLSILLHKSSELTSDEDDISDYRFKINRVDGESSSENGPIYIHQHRHHMKRHNKGSCQNCPNCAEVQKPNNPMENVVFLPSSSVNQHEEKVELKPGLHGLHQFPGRSEHHWPHVSEQQWPSNQETVHHWPAHAQGAQLPANGLVQHWPAQQWAVRSQPQYHNHHNQAHQRLWQGNPVSQWPANHGIASQWAGNPGANGVQWPEGSWPGSAWPANGWPGNPNLNMQHNIGWQNAGAAARYFLFKGKNSTKVKKIKNENQATTLQVHYQ
nr:uncharacterized protein LOC128674946 [Plodia interpunctella]